jgi:hypothetical protein
MVYFTYGILDICCGQLICLVAHMVNYVFYGKMYGRLSALHTWLWWVEINVRNDVQLLHIILTVPQGSHLHFVCSCVGFFG